MGAILSVVAGAFDGLTWPWRMASWWMLQWYFLGVKTVTAAVVGVLMWPLRTFAAARREPKTRAQLVILERELQEISEVMEELGGKLAKAQRDRSRIFQKLEKALQDRSRLKEHILERCAQLKEVDALRKRMEGEATSAKQDAARAEDDVKALATAAKIFERLRAEYSVSVQEEKNVVQVGDVDAKHGQSGTDTEAGTGVREASDAAEAPPETSKEHLHESRDPPAPKVKRKEGKVGKRRNTEGNRAPLSPEPVAAHQECTQEAKPLAPLVGGVQGHQKTHQKEIGFQRACVVSNVLCMGASATMAAIVVWQTGSTGPLVASLLAVLVVLGNVYWLLRQESVLVQARKESKSDLEVVPQSMRLNSSSGAALAAGLDAITGRHDAVTEGQDGFEASKSSQRLETGDFAGSIDQAEEDSRGGWVMEGMILLSLSWFCLGVLTWPACNQVGVFLPHYWRNDSAISLAGFHHGSHIPVL